MIKKITMLLCVSFSAFASAQGDLSELKDRIKGPPVMFQVTADCDHATLEGIESSLKTGQRKIYFYKYTILLVFKGHKLDKIELNGMDFSDPVRQCIIQGFMDVSHTNGEYPEKGVAPIEIEFPAIITPKGET